MFSSYDDCDDEGGTCCKCGEPAPMTVGPPGLICYKCSEEGRERVVQRRAAIHEDINKYYPSIIWQAIKNVAMQKKKYSAEFGELLVKELRAPLSSRGIKLKSAEFFDANKDDLIKSIAYGVLERMIKAETIRFNYGTISFIRDNLSGTVKYSW